MKFLQRFWQPFVAFTLVLSLCAPATATAQDTLDPFDDNIQEFLASLNIELQPTDRLWQDKEFVEFVSSYQNIQSEIRSMAESFITMAHEALDLLEAGASIEDPRVREGLELPVDISDEELAEIKMELADMRAELDKASSEFLTDEMLFGDMNGIEGMFELVEFIALMSEFDNLDSDFNDEYDYENMLWVYAWADTFEAVEAGNIVNLMSEIEGPFTNEEVEVTWTQTYGPEVMWLNTDSKFNASFIVPEYDTLGDETFLEFEVRVNAGDQEDYAYVFVDLVVG